MQRFRYLLDTIEIESNLNSDTFNQTIQSQTTTSRIVGLFPFMATVNPTTTKPNIGHIDFIPSAIEAFSKLASKNISVILFINQFKNHPLNYESFMSMNQAVEKFLTSTGIKVSGLYWCPSTDKNDPYVVPNSGMFVKAKENQKITWSGIPIVSSSENDLIAAEKAGAMPIKIGKAHAKWKTYPTFIDFADSL